MRLIDADELRKKIVARVVHGEDKIDRGFNLGIGAALDLLNVAPTVIKCGTTSDGLPLFDLTPRPQGEWILNEGKLNNPICNQCGCKNDYVRNFCPVCGSDMRGGEI